MVKKRATRKRSTRPKSRVQRRRPSSNEVELSDVRRVVTKKIKHLRTLEQTPRVSEAIGRMEEALSQVTQMCGDHMIFPIR